MHELTNSRPRLPTDNLPLSLSSLVGRQQDIEAICSQLERDDVRLFTVTGTGGVGKTRLALEAATAARARYDETWLVELAGINEPDLVIPAIASVVGVREEAVRPLLLTLAEALQPRRMLLVLDNCEHLLGATARVSEHLLAHCPTLTILATSRQRLGVPGEIVWQTQPLAVPQLTDAANPAQLLRSDAVHLFVARANAAFPRFALSAASAPAVAYICRQLDGIPLAIELAARWVSTLSVDEIAMRLEDRFCLLVGASHTAVTRQQTLRGAVEWSYDLLDHDEQMLFNRLAVFADGCTLAAIEAVCTDQGIAAGDIVHLLARLIDASLVTRLDRDGETRYRVAETLRLFARERLVAADQSQHIYRRHAEFYLALAECAEPELWGANLRAWLDRLEEEHDNLRAALRWATGRGEAEIALRLGIALGRFWRLRGHASEGLRWLEGALAWTLGATPAHRASAFDTAGHLARDRGAYEVAERYYAASLALRRELEDKPGTALALNNLATVVQFQGDHARAVALLEESLAHFRDALDVRGEALTLVTLGAVAHLQMDIDRALSWYQEGLGVFRMLDDRRGLAATLNNLGNLAIERCDPVMADRYYQESLQLFHALGDDHDAAACLGNLARLARDRNNLVQAVTFCQDSLRRFASLGNGHGTASSVTLLADLTARRGALNRAAQLLGAAATLREAAGLEPISADTPLYRSIQGRLNAADFSHAFAHGRALSTDAAVVLALAAEQEPVAGAEGEPGMPNNATRLTRREREVAALVAQGLTNRQIAERLCIAERTADAHLEHILGKLEVNTRAQVAAWVVTHGSSPEN